MRLGDRRGGCLRKQRLARTGRAFEQHALDPALAVGREHLGVEERHFDRLAQLCLGLLLPADVIPFDSRELRPDVRRGRRKRIDATDHVARAGIEHQAIVLLDVVAHARRARERAHHGQEHRLDHRSILGHALDGDDRPGRDRVADDLAHLECIAVDEHAITHLGLAAVVLDRLHDGGATGSRDDRDRALVDVLVVPAFAFGFDLDDDGAHFGLLLEPRE